MSLTASVGSEKSNQPVLSQDVSSKLEAVFITIVLVDGKERYRVNEPQSGDADKLREIFKKYNVK